MPRSLLEAIKQGDWSFEPSVELPGGLACEGLQRATTAMPGTAEKLGVLAERLQRGLPLWHPSDRRTFNDTDQD